MHSVCISVAEEVMRIWNKKAQKNWRQWGRKIANSEVTKQGFPALSSNELILITNSELRVDINQNVNDWPCQVARWWAKLIGINGLKIKHTCLTLLSELNNRYNSKLESCIPHRSTQKWFVDLNEKPHLV